MNKRLNILLVDDDEEEYILLKELIAEGTALSRFHLEWVGSFEEGLVKLDECRHDLFLIDYHLGVRSGLELLKTAVGRGCKAPIVILTGQGTYEIDLAAMEAGAADYLVKGQINFPLLERSIRYAIERKQTENILDSLVEERTRALAETNRELQAEIVCRKETEISLRESENKFRALTEITSAAIFIVGRAEAGEEAANDGHKKQAGVIRYANPAAKYITGYAPEELLRKPFVDLLHPAYRPVFLQRGGLSQWMADIPARYELKIIKKDGEERWVDITTGQIEYEQQPAWVITAFDITERDRAEQALRLARDRLEAEVAERTNQLKRRADELAALNQATSALLTTLDLETLLGQILDAAQSAIQPAEHSWLHLAANRAARLQRFYQSAFEDGRILRLELHSQDADLLRPLLEGKPLRLDQAPRDRRIWAFLPGFSAHSIKTAPRRKARAQSAIIAPLMLDGEVFGSLSLTAARPGAFTDADLHLLASFAATASAAVQNAVLHAELQNLATTDPLTGLLNRRAIFELGQREVDRYHRLGHPLSVLMFDIDYFKSINDTYGHAVGDQVLGQVVARCFANIRNVDILGRYGGDEFIILLTEADAGLARSIAERVRRAIQEKPVQTDAGLVTVSVSMGLTGPTAATRELSDFVKAADQALYRAKQAGRNRVEVLAPLLKP